MGIKHIHLLIISASAVFAIVFGCWILKHHYTVSAYASFAAAAALGVYGVKFFIKTKAL